jgi:hypothetical protein
VTAPTPRDPLACLNSRAAAERPLCGEPDSAHCEKCQSCPGTCVCSPARKWRRGDRVRVTFDAVIFGEPRLNAETHALVVLPSTDLDNAPILGRYRVPVDALTSQADHAAILASRRNQLIETDRLRTQVQELQAEVNRLNRLHDERDAIERGRLNTKENS